MIVKWIVIPVLWCVIVSPEGNSAALLIDAVRDDFFKLEDQLWDYVIDYDEKEGSKDPEGYLLRKFREFDAKVQQLPQDLEYGLDVSRRAYDFLWLFADFKRMHNLYDKFVTCQNKYLSVDGIDGFKREALTANIVDDVLNDQNNNINLTSRRIFDRVFSKNRGSIVMELVEITTDGEYMCKNYAQTPQQIYHHLYNAITLADLKGYILSQFAYLSEALLEQGNHKNLALEARQEYKKRTQKYIVTFRDLMQITKSHNKLWRCDPSNHIEGQTYEQITRLLQYHIENEADINWDRSCNGICYDYSNTRSYGCYDTGSTYCHKRKSCSGRLLNCQEGSTYSVCISDSSSLRRYDYIKTESGTVYGNDTWCSGVTTPSWTVYCSSCLCLCDEPGRLSDRFFNLRQVTSNVTDNRVVTGVRLVKHNRIMHVQIQEGQLLPYGYINQSSVRWLPVDDYRITDGHVRENVDYHTMSFEHRDLFLDDLNSHEDDHIITGVGFIYRDGHLKLQVNVRKFNYENGILENDNHYISGATSYRDAIYLRNGDIPNLYHNSDLYLGPYLRVKFTHTSLSKDAGQTTIPFIDSQPVATSPATPLKGVGIHWRGRSDNGGFVAPVITSYDFEQNMGIGIPDPPPRDERKYEVIVI